MANYHNKGKLHKKKKKKREILGYALAGGESSLLPD